MTLQQLEYIVAVYRTRHFAKAAEQCGVTQPTLSAMIQKLEAELDIRIFERSSQQVTPTPIGKMVVEQAWKVIQRANKLKDIVATLNGKGYETPAAYYRRKHPGKGKSPLP